MWGDRREMKWWWSLVTAVALVTVSGCSDSEDAPDPVGAAGYAAVIDEFLPPPSSDETRPVVFVASLDVDPFPLDGQIEMIAAVEETHDLRFVDDFAAAVDDEEEQQEEPASDTPPRPDEVLFGIGPISPIDPHVVRVEVRTAIGLIEAYRVTLEVNGGDWRVETSESIDPQVLVGDE